MNRAQNQPSNPQFGEQFGAESDKTASLRPRRRVRARTAPKGPNLSVVVHPAARTASQRTQAETPPLPSDPLQRARRQHQMGGVSTSAGRSPAREWDPLSDLVGPPPSLPSQRYRAGVRSTLEPSRNEARAGGDLRRRSRGRRTHLPLSSAASFTNTGSAYAAPGQQTMARPSKALARSSTSRQRSRLLAPFLYALRLLILGVGLGVIAGTVLSVWDPTGRYMTGIGPMGEPALPTATTTQPETPPTSPPALDLGQEMTVLKQQVQALASTQPDLTPGVFMIDLDTNAYVDLNGSMVFPAASMIKVPILVAFFQDVDAGKIRLDEELPLTEDVVAEGSGDLQYQPIGSKFSALETATLMIVISDNTATNMLIKRLGGKEALNQRFQSWGLSHTVINSPLADLAGTNTTTPKDLVSLMALVNRGDLVSLRSRDRLLDIMRRTETNTLLPQGLGPNATIAHKTGDIASTVGDVGLIDLPDGKRYLATVIVKRPDNDDRAQELIRQISKVAYTAFAQQAAATPTPAPASPTAPTAAPTGAIAPMAPNPSADPTASTREPRIDPIDEVTPGASPGAAAQPNAAPAAPMPEP
ncbi:class A beta-lactamase-related serine hydrolase [Trichothermofontia sichuanensis B231]|uniref:serine hydrolase n=1 Tax=Trichothermofontia sichuanensis TaxID=3045816 RepID=UPI00224526D8|nr:serine hydrolase [Trichothermofontia sichuanensis]UZQ55524.1 class A beta-lactamase-related serine hydrolase [Trichothermofontia sichuanensis B231]